MIWISDFRLLEPQFLFNDFRPYENGIDSDTLAKAFSALDREVLSYLYAHINPTLLRSIPKLSLRPSQQDLIDAQIRLVATYFWELAYRKYPEQYEQFSNLQRFALDRLFPRSKFIGKIVLDIGCGTGKLLDYLARISTFVFGIDPCGPMLEVARRKHAASSNVSIEKGGFANIPLPDRSVDVVASNMAFQYHERSGGIIGLHEMKRVLRPGGEIRLVVGNPTTQDFLLRLGFRERFVPHGLIIREDCDSDVTVKCMCALALQGSTHHLNVSRHYLSAAGEWRFSWTLSNIWAWLRGTPYRQLFHQGKLHLPSGLAVYTWKDGADR
ncbi:class I SAM-dependent methyltransferase [Caballeronia sp. AZ1_KS37]|uniref:class I SAM-dependent methyltransferase n=1 Tax=Caballeronia sp. AZ1_KS37 TaxID=2921756 RepID=UPI0020288D3B|nr:class I SAM-dependent methyltransferase [Caballeronia sp. AZ1_KS37]